MDVIRHRPIAAALALLLGLALFVLGRCALRPDDASQKTEPHLAATSARQAGTPSGQAQVPPPVIVQSTPAPSAATGGTLRGQVIDAATRQPIREFVLKLRRSDSLDHTARAWEVREYAAQDGRFAWDRVEPTTWLLGVVAKGYQNFVASGIEVRAGEATEERILPLQAGSAVRGRVFDRTTGAGLAAASVMFQPRTSDMLVVAGDESWRLRPSAVTGKEGTFVLEGLPPGRGTVVAWSENYAGQRMEITVGRSTRPLAIGLTHGATIAGRMVTADERAQVAGHILLLTPDGNGTLFSSTKEDGSFSFDNLDAGSYTLRGESGALYAQQPIEIAADERREGIVLLLRTGQRIRGRVTGLPADALAELRIRTLPVEGPPLYWDKGAKVDENGMYVVHNVSRGRVRLLAASDSGTGRSMDKTVEVPPSGDLTVNLEFPRGVRLSGRVTRDGKPFADGWITPQAAGQQSIHASGTRLSPEGDYVIDGLPRGDYRLHTMEYVSEVIRVTGDMVFDIDLAGGRLSGRVLLDGSEVPIASVSVSIWPAQRRASRLQLLGGSNQFGEFTLTGLAPGDYILTAYKPGHTMYRERLSYASSTDRIEIRMRPEPGVKVVVRDAVTGDALRPHFMSELLESGAVHYWPLDIDTHAVIRIPGGLAGATLSFGVQGYGPAMIRNWDGQPLDLRLTRQAPDDAQ